MLSMNKYKNRFSICLLLILLSVFSMNSCNVKYAYYANSELVIQDNVKYQISYSTKKALAGEFILNHEQQNTEITVPDYIENDITVEGLGYVSKGDHGVVFSMTNGKKMISSNVEYFNTYYKDYPIVEHYLTIYLGNKIKDADTLMNERALYYLIQDDGTVIRLNIYIQVSSDNKYYYSENGILYKQADPG